MSSAVLDNLLDRLNAGDEAAAEQVYLDYQPYLRMLVSRQLRPSLRAKFDTMDVVQSVWADLLVGIRRAGWRFADRAHLQALLVRLRGIGSSTVVANTSTPWRGKCRSRSIRPPGRSLANCRVPARSRGAMSCGIACWR